MKIHFNNVFLQNHSSENDFLFMCIYYHIPFYLSSVFKKILTFYGICDMIDIEQRKIYIRKEVTYEQVFVCLSE